MGELIRFTNSDISEGENDSKAKYELEYKSFHNHNIGDKSLAGFSPFWKALNVDSLNLKEYIKYDELSSSKLDKVGKTQSNQKEGELVMDEGYKQLINRLDQDAREREERYERRSKEMEDRVTKLYGDSIKRIEDKLTSHEKLLETKFEVLNTKIDHIEKQVNEVHNRTRFWVNLFVPCGIAIIVGIITVFASLYVTKL